MPANKNILKKDAEKMLKQKAVFIEACRAYMVCENGDVAVVRGTSESLLEIISEVFRSDP